MPVKPSGPSQAKILVVGEAPGAEEQKMGMPFVGSSGQELRRMLSQAGINPNEVRFTNVFDERPENNKIEAFCGKRGDVGKDYSHIPLSVGNYILPKYLGALDRLAGEVADCGPDLVVPVGNTACWALLKRTGIGKLRGNVFPCELAPGLACLPTYHPAAILRDWSLRVVGLADLMKAKRYVVEGFSVPKRRLWLDPSLREIEDFVEGELQDCGLLAFDIETRGGQITCIGFSPRPDLSLTIPFYDERKPDHNFWPQERDELRAWEIVRDVLGNPVPKLGQNGLYDIQYLLAYGIKVNNYSHDTMIRHHALFPELEKGLGFMGSIYSDESPWKLLRTRARDVVERIGE